LKNREEIARDIPFGFELLQKITPAGLYGVFAY